LKIIVTDLTRFANKNIVCLAGINPATGDCIRPMLPSQNGRLDYLTFQTVKNHNIIPGSCLEGNFVRQPNLSAPHVEDHRTVGFLKDGIAATGAVFKQVLDESSFTTLKAAFGELPVNRLYVLAAPPPLSIITLKLTSPRTQFKLVADSGFGTLKLKANVKDATGYELFNLPVTDLGFCDHLAKIRESDPQLIQLNSFIQTQRIVYLRIGLTRRYMPSPETPSREGYWVQLNGIYSFPNYRKEMRVYD